MIKRLNSGGPTGNMPLSGGVVAGDFLFISGQVAMDDEGRITLGTFEDEVNLAMENVRSILSEEGVGFESVVKATVFLSNAALFQEFNEIYKGFFDGAFPARSAVVLGFGDPQVRVEIEAVAFLGSPSE